MTSVEKLLKEIGPNRSSYIENCFFNLRYYHMGVTKPEKIRKIYEINIEYYTLHLMGLFETSIIRDIFS